MTGPLSLPDSKAVPPALYLVLCDALAKDRSGEPGFTQKDLDNSFRLWLKDRAEDKGDLKMTARDILKPADPKKKLAPSPIEQQALAVIGVAEAAPETEEFESEEMTEEFEDVESFVETEEYELDGFDFEEYEDEADLRAALLDYAAHEHAGKAVAALLLAEEITPSSELAAQSCKILLDKYGTQSVTADEKHMVLDGIAAASTDRDRADFHDKFSVLAAHESDADKTLAQKLSALQSENDPRKLLVDSLRVNTGDVALVGAQRQSHGFAPPLTERKESFVSVKLRDPLPNDTMTRVKTGLVLPAPKLS